MARRARFDLFGDLGDLGALVLELAVEACVGFGDLSEVAANAFGHGDHGGFGCLLGGGLGGEVLVRHGDEAGDVGEEFEELGDDLWPHSKILILDVDTAAGIGCRSDGCSGCLGYTASRRCRYQAAISDCAQELVMAGDRFWRQRMIRVAMVRRRIAVMMPWDQRQ